MSNIPAIGQYFEELDVTDSTNNYAMARVSNGQIGHGYACSARRQTAGKGQRGKDWHTEEGTAIILSAVVEPAHLPPGDQFMLSATVALGALDFFRRYAGTETSIKWSNDLYWRDRKAGGILIENVLRGNRWSHAVIGIGININEERFPPQLPNPVSLKQITGHHYDVRQLTQELCTCLERRYRQLQPSQYARILAEYTGALFRLNEPARYRNRQGDFRATIKGVKPDGRLLLQTDEQLLEALQGEIEFVISSPAPFSIKQNRPAGQQGSSD